MRLALTPRHAGSVYILECDGQILYGEEERALEAALEHAHSGFSRFVLNLSGVTRLDSMGLGMLVRHHTRVAKHGGAIHLAGAPPFVTNLLELTRLSATIPNFETEDEAVLAFRHRQSGVRPDDRRGLRLLVFDPSADLCIFAKSVLSRHGFDVRTSCAFGDAKLLLRASQMEFVLVGPGTAQLPGEVAARDLSAVAPRASVLRLAPDFMSHDAMTATQILLQVCGVSDGSQAS